MSTIPEGDPATAGGSPAGDRSGPHGMIRVTNGGREPIVRVCFSPAEDGRWGAARLAPGDLIAPATGRTWTVAPGRWDVRLDRRGGDVHTWFGLDVRPGETCVLNVG